MSSWNTKSGTLEASGNRDAGDLSKEIVELGPWFHNLHLPSGTQTAPGHPLGDFPAFKWSELAGHLPKDLSGWRALDVGCNAGFYSFALAERGAEVLGIDVNPRYLEQARWARKKYPHGDRVRLEQRHVYDLGRSSEMFDLVLFMGVFYHLRYPVLGLDAVADACERVLVFQSLSMSGDEVLSLPKNLTLDDRDRMDEPGWPKMAYISGKLHDDATNWWAPNRACVERLLGDTGFEVVARPGHELYVARRSREREKGSYRDSEELRHALGERKAMGG